MFFAIDVPFMLAASFEERMKYLQEGNDSLANLLIPNSCWRK